MTALALPLLCTQAVAEDSPQSLYERGFKLLNDYEGKRKTKLEGWTLMNKAAEAGYLEAKIDVADYYAGFVVVTQPPDMPALFKPNMDRALEYLRDAVRSGHAESMVHLALLYSSGIGEPRDESETPHRLLLGAAGKGNAEAMLHLSDRYLYGHGEKVDLLEAARWRYSAWQGSSSDRFYFLDDQGNPKIQENVPMTELAEILSLMTKAAEQRNTSAISTLKAKYAEAGKPNAPELKELLGGTWHKISGSTPEN